MNDYIAKPVDEKILYSKIIGSVKKPLSIDNSNENPNLVTKSLKYTDLHYLITRTKANPILMMEMISLYLEQTPPLISAMKQSWKEKDWSSLYSAVHKMIPSFSIMGISADYENMAKKVQDYAKTQEQSDGISDLVLQIENVCTQACTELQVEFNKIKDSKNEK
jgi:HPt (histidine-containing phosphotransfer) domain-containing protein